MIIELMNSKLDLNKVGVCGVPQFQGIYLKFYVNTTGFNGDFYIYNLFNPIQIIRNETINGFIEKIEKYLEKDRDLKDILKFKKYKDIATPVELDYIKACYNKWLRWEKKEGVL